MALCSPLRTSTEIRLRENSRSASAVSTFLPRMSWARRLSFCGLTRSMRTTALASFSPRARSVFGFDISASLSLLVRGMTVERARRREFAELVADHVLVHVDRDMLVAIVNAERQTDELRQDGERR